MQSNVAYWNFDENVYSVCNWSIFLVTHVTKHSEIRFEHVSWENKNRCTFTYTNDKLNSIRRYTCIFNEVCCIVFCLQDSSFFYFLVKLLLWKICLSQKIKGFVPTILRKVLFIVLPRYCVSLMGVTQNLMFIHIISVLSYLLILLSN